jgi:agmatinase
MELPVVGLEVVEVSPPYDHAEVTAYLGSRIVLEALAGLAWQRRARAGLAHRRPEDPLLDR